MISQNSFTISPIVLLVDGHCGHVACVTTYATAFCSMNTILHVSDRPVTLDSMGKLQRMCLREQSSVHLPPLHNNNLKLT